MLPTQGTSVMRWWVFSDKKQLCGVTDNRHLLRYSFIFQLYVEQYHQKQKIYENINIKTYVYIKYNNNILKLIFIRIPKIYYLFIKILKIPAEYSNS